MRSLSGLDGLMICSCDFVWEFGFAAFAFFAL